MKVDVKFLYNNKDEKTTIYVIKGPITIDTMIIPENLNYRQKQKIKKDIQEEYEIKGK